jgi:hypothetical protein
MPQRNRIANPIVLMFLRIQDVAAPTLVSLANTWEQNYHRIRSLYGVRIPLIALLEELYKESRGGAQDGPVLKSSAATE